MNKEHGVDILIEKCTHLLTQRDYSKNYQKRLADYWTHLRGWLIEHEIYAFSEEIGNRYCDAIIGGHLAESGKFSRKQKEIFRAVRMLISYQKIGDIEPRPPVREYIFEGFWGECAKVYLNSISQLAAATVRQRTAFLERLVIFFNEREISFDGLNTRLMSDFWDYSAYSENSKQCALTCFRSFFKYLNMNGYTDVDCSIYLFKIKKPKKKIPSTYTEDEIKRLLDVVDRSSPLGKRDYLILLIICQYGLRAGDVSNLQFKHINWDRNEISFIQQKTKVSITQPLTAAVGNALIEYLKYGRPKSDSPMIFLSIQKTIYPKPISSSAVTALTARYFSRAGIEDWQNKKHGPHSLRFSLATNMLKQNEPLPLISTVLGHQSTETTKIYLKVDVNKLRSCCLTPPPMNSKEYFGLEFGRDRNG